MRATLSLRWRLLLLWLIMLVISSTLAYIIYDVYQLGSEAQAQKSTEQVMQACAELQSEYTHSIKPGEEMVDTVLMSALLNIILGDMPGVEGGFWYTADGFVAYAYPTHTGSERKKDMPSTERKRIEKLVRESLERGAPNVNLIHGNREIIVLAACPADFPETRVAVWTMSRLP
ncbi:hypothetical protein, partial [Nitrosomonas sp.]|uniref:hypothetical protein n=1 Tax=Nitrosomonas sp. TaxID=42353 RepID=UPI0035AEF1C1